MKKKSIIYVKIVTISSPPSTSKIKNKQIYAPPAIDNAFSSRPYLWDYPISNIYPFQITFISTIKPSEDFNYSLNASVASLSRNNSSASMPGL